MSKVRLLVGTRKGAFVLTADGTRERWDANRLYASQSSSWFGQVIQRSNDGGQTWESAGNKFAYDGPTGTHQWYDGTPHPWEFARVWHLEPAPNDPDTVYAGVEDAALFRTTDGGRSWQELPGLRNHGSGSQWQPGAGGMCLHTILLDLITPGRMFVAISAAGTFRSDDSGATWRAINKGLVSEQIPNHTAEVGHCVAGESWREVSGNLPSDFGFPIDVHAHEPETVYVVPIKSDSEHYPPDGKLRVYRSRTGGNDWEALTNGLPQQHCYVNVLRDAMTVDSLDPCGVYLGTTGGRVYGSRDGGDSRAPIVRDLPSVVSPWRSRRCHDPGGAAPASADARARRGRGEARRSRARHAARGAGRARGGVPDAPRDDPRSRHAPAPRVPARVRVRAGSLARLGGRAAARGGGRGHRAALDRRRDGRRI